MNLRSQESYVNLVTFQDVNKLHSTATLYLESGNFYWQGVGGCRFFFSENVKLGVTDYLLQFSWKEKWGWRAFLLTTHARKWIAVSHKFYLLIHVENHIKTYTRKTVCSHFLNIRTKIECPTHAVEHLNTFLNIWSKRERSLSSKCPFRRLLFTKIEHTKLKPYVVKISRTDRLWWCDKKILKTRLAKTIGKTGWGSRPFHGL
jgi:hypothetical protein